MAAHDTDSVRPDTSRLSPGAAEIKSNFSPDDRVKLQKVAAQTFESMFDANDPFDSRKVKPDDLGLALLIARLEKGEKNESNKAKALKVIRLALPDLSSIWLNDLRKAVKSILTDPAKAKARAFTPNIINEDNFHTICEYAKRQIENPQGPAWQKLFKFGSEFVEVSTDAKTGEASIDVLNYQTFKARVNEYVVFRQSSGGEKRPTLQEVSCPDDVAGYLYAHNLGLRDLVGLIRAPTFDAAGSLISEPGHHAATGLYYVPPRNLNLNLPAQVTPKDLKEARETLCDLFADFRLDGLSRKEFTAAVMGDKGEAPPSFLAVVGFLLEQPCRHLIGANPLMGLLVSKAVPGAGGGLLAKVLQMIIEGKTHSRPLAKSEEERRKAVFSVLRGARATTFWDNLPKGVELDSAVVASLLTEDVWLDRELGRSVERAFPIRCSFVFVGNRPLFSDELLRRVVLCELAPKELQPELRTDFDIADLLDHVTDHRAKYLRCALILILHWIQQKKPMPTQSKALGSYGAYHRVVVGVLEASGWNTWGTNRNKLDSLAAGDEMEAIENLVQAWSTRADAFTGAIATKDIAVVAGAEGVDLPIMKNPPTDPVLYNTKSLTRYLKSFSGRSFEVSRGEESVRVSFEQESEATRGAKRRAGGWAWRLSVVKDYDTEPASVIEPANIVEPTSMVEPTSVVEPDPKVIPIRGRRRATPTTSVSPESPFAAHLTYGARRK